MKRPLKPRYRFDQNAHHFQLLGLKRGECRIEVIRQAARRRATDIAGRSHPATIDLHRAEIAVATYRLLDPRGRTQLYERVQLSCPVDSIETEQAPFPPQSSLNRKLNLAATTASKPENSTANPQNVRMMGGRVVEQAIEQPGECPKDAPLEEGESKSPSTRYLQVCRTNENSRKNTLRGESAWSTVDWIRACLGI